MELGNIEPIWNTYRSRLLAFLRGRVSDDAEADDLLQEVFIRVHYHLCCLPQPEKMDSWIFQIARNLVIDHYRRRRHSHELPDDFPMDFEFPENEPQAELAFSLRQMVVELPELYRDALLQTEYEGLSQVELAGKLGVSVSAVKSRVQRGREKLREMILTCCHIEFDRRGQVLDYYERCCCCNPEN